MRTGAQKNTPSLLEISSVVAASPPHSRGHWVVWFRRPRFFACWFPLRLPFWALLSRCGSLVPASRVGARVNGQKWFAAVQRRQRSDAGFGLCCLALRAGRYVVGYMRKQIRQKVAPPRFLPSSPESEVTCRYVFCVSGAETRLPSSIVIAYRVVRGEL